MSLHGRACMARGACWAVVVLGERVVVCWRVCVGIGWVGRVDACKLCGKGSVCRPLEGSSTRVLVGSLE